MAGGKESEKDMAVPDDSLAASEIDVDFSAGEVAPEVSASECPEHGSVIQEEMEALRREKEDFRNKYLMALADYENFKKRAIKERAELLKYQGEQVFSDIISIVDNLDLAVQHKDADPEQLKSGVEMIHRMFLDVLSKWDVRGESAVGLAFDPAKHHALSRIESAEAEPGTVLNELKKAYFFKDKLLRAAEVVVAAPRSEPETEQS